jgi:hypothetical protein
MVGGESPRGEASARARDDDRRLEPNRVHERHQVGGELLNAVAGGGPVGIAVAALGHREGVDRPREMRQ